MPLLGRDVDGFAKRYLAYFNEHEGRAVREPPLRMLDPAPRVVLDPELGLCTAGQTVALAQAAGDLYLHTVQAILRAEALERWKPLTAAELFEVEYWELEQAKLWRKGSPLELAGEVAVVTGAASGIGRAIAQLLLEKGAAVCGIDKSDQVLETGQGLSYLGVVCDLTDEAAVRRNLDQVVRSFGGIDIMVLNAGVFPPSTRVESLSSADWRRIFAINLDSNMALMATAHRYLRLAPRGGPGPGCGLEERQGARAGCGCLFRLQGGADPAVPGRGPRVGRRRHPRKRAPPERGLRHRDLERRSHRATRQAVRREP